MNISLRRFLIAAILFLSSAGICRPESDPELPTLFPSQVETQALVLLDGGKQRDAEDLLKKYVVVYPYNQRLTFILACCWRSRFRLEESFELFKSVVSLDPNSASGRCSHHLLYLDAKQDVEHHFEGLRRLVENHPKDLMLRWMLAVQCRSYDKNEEGIRHYRELLKKWDPGPALLHQTFANELDAVGKH